MMTPEVEAIQTITIKVRNGGIVIRKPGPFEAVDMHNTMVQILQGKDRFGEDTGVVPSGRKRTAAMWAWAFGWVGMLWAGPNAERIPTIKWKDIHVINGVPTDVECGYLPDSGDAPPPEELILYGEKVLKTLNLGFMDLESVVLSITNIVRSSLGHADDDEEAVEKARDFFVPLAVSDTSS